MPTPPRESIGGRATAFENQAFIDHINLYDVLIRGERHKESEEFQELPEEEQEDFLNELDFLEQGYEILRKRVARYAI